MMQTKATKTIIPLVNKFRAKYISVLCGMKINEMGLGKTIFNLVTKSKNFGDAGHRSQCLSHAKQALYHLSYTPNI